MTKKVKKKPKNQPPGTPQPQTAVQPTSASANAPTTSQPMTKLPTETSTEPTQNLAQKRAKDALAKVKKLEEAGVGTYKKYVPYVKALPATIILSGLGQALAMEKAGAKKMPGHALLFEHMDDWLRNGWQTGPYGEFDNILSAITKCDEASYIRAQAEAMEYLEWLKKFAVAFLVEDKGPEDGS